MRNLIGKTVGPYEIVDKIGEGGMGVVFKARDVRLDRTVALKFLPPHLLEEPDQRVRFIQEAQTASSLDHPNVCTIFEVNTTEDGEMYIAMAYYEGDTLRSKLRAGRFYIDEALDIAVHLARGLARAHEAGIVHRDVKPANIMVTDRGEVKILDFGVAKLTAATALTRTGTTVGTVSYMSPEQARGDSVDHRTDVWALGVILYQMATGELPFKGDFDHAVVYFILHEDPPPPRSIDPAVPEEVERVILKAMRKMRDERYQTMDDMLFDLEIARGKTPTDVSVTAATGTIAGAAGTRDKRRRGRWLGFAGIAVILAVAGFFLARDHGASPAAVADADRARNLMAQAERSAVGAGADEKATAQMTEARVLRARADAAYDAEEYDDARALYDESRGMFEVSLASSLRIPADEVAPKEADGGNAGAEKPAVAAGPDGDSGSGQVGQETSPPAVRQPEAAEPARPKTPSPDAAIAQRSRMERAREGALAAGAPTLAAGTFAQAERAAMAGGDAMSKRDYDTAGNRFDEAAREFEAATAEAEEATQALAAESKQLRAQVSSLRATLTEHDDLVAFQEAQAAEDEAGRLADAGDSTGAVAALRRALAGYEAAQSERRQDRADIEALVSAYASALEGESVDGMRSLHPAMDGRTEDTWKRFFDTVSDLSADMTVERIRFAGGRATADVDVALRYEGVDESTNRPMWRMELMKTDGTWRVAGINRNAR